MKNFFHLVGSGAFADLFREFSELGTETIPLSAALNRYAAQEIVAPTALPPFSRSTMDGYAVRAEDTDNISQHPPRILTVTNEIRMGYPGHNIILRAGEAVRIWTGGELPDNADAVIMIEDCRSLDDGKIEIIRTVAPGENIIRAGEDYQRGEFVFGKGTKLCPRYMGVLAGLGITEANVFKRPEVGIISSGDELVEPADSILTGQIRDINSTTLAALVTEAGGIPVPLGIVADNFALLRDTCRAAVNRPVDLLLVSGGSSAGKKDFTQAVFKELDQSDLHERGAAVRPDKPLLIARHGNCVLFGLPGHAASAMAVFYLFIRPLLMRFSGANQDGFQRIFVQAGERISATAGLEEYVRVRLIPRKDAQLPLAIPVYGKAGFLRPLLEADGLLVLKAECHVLNQGDMAEVILFS